MEAEEIGSSCGGMWRWDGRIGMRREDWDEKERLGWGGKIEMGSEDWIGEEKLEWGGKIGMGMKD